MVVQSGCRSIVNKFHWHSLDPKRQHFNKNKGRFDFQTSGKEYNSKRKELRFKGRIRIAYMILCGEAIFPRPLKLCISIFLSLVVLIT